MADTPARAVVKNIKSHMAKYFCKKCQVSKSIPVPNSKVKLWPATNLEPRLDHLFESYPEHTKKVQASPSHSCFFCVMYKEE
jgi:hypothetical protein